MTSTVSKEAAKLETGAKIDAAKQKYQKSTEKAAVLKKTVSLVLGDEQYHNIVYTIEFVVLLALIIIAIVLSSIINYRRIKHIDGWNRMQTSFG